MYESPVPVQRLVIDIADKCQVRFNDDKITAFHADISTSGLHPECVCQALWRGLAGSMITDKCFWCKMMSAGGRNGSDWTTCLLQLPFRKLLRIQSNDNWCSFTGLLVIKCHAILIGWKAAKTYLEKHFASFENLELKDLVSFCILYFAVW